MNLAASLLLVSSGLLPVVLSGQANDSMLREDREQQRTPCVLTGEVIDSATQRPLPEISINVVGPSYSTTIKTDSSGVFAFSGKTCGQYNIFTDLTHEHLMEGATVMLRDGHVTHRDLVLRRGGVLLGRVVNREKNGMAGVNVSARVMGIRNGRPSLISFSSARTDSEGRFRIGRLEPGKYIVEAEPAAETARRLSEPEFKEGVRNIKTFYGGSSSIEGAVSVLLKPDQVIEALDITLNREKTVCVFFEAAGDSWAGPLISAVLSDLYPSSQSEIGSVTGKLSTPLEICGVPKGDYRLSIFAQDKKHGTAFASRLLTITDKDVNVSTLVLEPGRQLHGRFETSDSHEELPPLQNVSVSLEARDRISVDGESLNTHPNDTGDFVVPCVVNDEYYLNVSGLPNGTYLKGATIGGKDVLRSSFVPSGSVVVKLGRDGAEVSGSVVDHAQQPVTNAAILALAQDHWGVAPYNELMTTRTDQNGRFLLSSIPPGTYHIVVLASVGIIQALDYEEISGALGDSTEVTLSAREKRTMTLLKDVEPQQ